MNILTEPLYCYDVRFYKDYTLKVIASTPKDAISKAIFKYCQKFSEKDKIFQDIKSLHEFGKSNIEYFKGKMVEAPSIRKSKKVEIYLDKLEKDIHYSLFLEDAIQHEVDIT
jgi:hypothetical protein